MDIFKIMMNDLRVSRSGELMDFSLPSEELHDRMIENETDDMLYDAGMEHQEIDNQLER